MIYLPGSVFRIINLQISDLSKPPVLPNGAIAVPFYI